MQSESRQMYMCKNSPSLNLGESTLPPILTLTVILTLILSYFQDDLP